MVKGELVGRFVDVDGVYDAATGVANENDASFSRHCDNAVEEYGWRNVEDFRGLGFAGLGINVHVDFPDRGAVRVESKGERLSHAIVQVEDVRLDFGDACWYRALWKCGHYGWIDRGAVRVEVIDDTFVNVSS